MIFFKSKKREHRKKSMETIESPFYEEVILPSFSRAEDMTLPLLKRTRKERGPSKNHENTYVLNIRHLLFGMTSTFGVLSY